MELQWYVPATGSKILVVCGRRKSISKENDHLCYLYWARKGLNSWRLMRLTYCFDMPSSEAISASLLSWRNDFVRIFPFVWSFWVTD